MPVICALAVPEPVIVAPEPLAGVIVPFIAETVVWTLAAPASTSATLSPVKLRLVSSLTVCALGTVFTGASFTLMIVIVKTFSKVSEPLSVLRTRIE